MATNSFMEADKLTGLQAFLLRETETRFRNAVRLQWESCERESIIEIVKALAEWSGYKTWKTSYEIKEFQTYMQRFDYGNELGVAVHINVERMTPTVRQFCYQFVLLAEAVRRENDLLENYWLYRFFRFFRRK